MNYLMNFFIFFSGFAAGITSILIIARLIILKEEKKDGEDITYDPPLKY
jgi:hypothetical protein